MASIDFTLSIPEKLFPEFFKKQETVQNTFDKLDIIQADSLKLIFDFRGDEAKEKKSMEMDEKNLTRLNRRIPTLQENLANETHEELKNEYNAELATAMRSRDRILARRARRDEADAVVERLDVHNKQLFVDGIDAWADKLGKWFETGALGAGTVTFKDKTYTAN